MFSPHVDINDPAITQAINDVRSNSATNWVVCGYVPREAKLKVLATGDGTVEDMLYELSDGKIHFCYLRYEMSETFKYIFIAWVGEGVTGQIKALSANHTKDFEDYLKKNNFNFAAQINARNESDVAEANIVKALNKTSTFIRAKTTQEKQAQPQTSLMDKRTNYWNKQTQVDEQHQQALQQRQKDLDSQHQRNRETETQRIQAQNEQIVREQDQWREQRSSEWKQRDAENSRAWNSRLEQQRAQYGGGQDSAPAANPQSWQQQREEVPRAQGFNAFGRGAAEVPQQAPAVGSRAPAAQPSYGGGGYDQPAQDSYGGDQGGYGDDQGGYGGDQGGYDQQDQGGYDQPAEDSYGGDQGGYGGDQGGYDQQDQGGYDQQDQGGYDQGGASGQRTVRAVYDCPGEQDGDLAFNSGDIITLLDDSDPDGWWRGELNGNQGVFPMNFVEVM